MKKFQSSSNLLVFTDKTKNLYEISKENYKKFLYNNISRTYIKPDNNIKGKIDKEVTIIAKSFQTQEKIECYAKQNAFFTFREQTKHFRSNIICRPFNLNVGYCALQRVK